MIGNFPRPSFFLSLFLSPCLSLHPHPPSQPNLYPPLPLSSIIFMTSTLPVLSSTLISYPLFHLLFKYSIFLRSFYLIQFSHAVFFSSKSFVCFFSTVASSSVPFTPSTSPFLPMNCWHPPMSLLFHDSLLWSSRCKDRVILVTSQK